MKKRDIEHIFKKELQDFEVNPPEHLWANISNEIDQKKKPKKIMPLWYIGSGIAASLLLLFILRYDKAPNSVNSIENMVNTTINDSCPEEAIVTNENSSNYNNEETQEEILLSNSRETTKEELVEDNTPSLNNTKEKDINNKTSISTIPTKESFVSNTNPTEKDPKGNNIDKAEIATVTKEKNKAKTTNAVGSEVYNQENSPSQNKELAFSENHNNKLNEKIDKLDLEDDGPNEIYPKKEEDQTEELSDYELAALLLEDQNDDEPKDNSSKKWSIQPQVGTYGYTSISGGSSINSEFNDNPQQIETDLSYGVRVAYQATPKLKIRTGITNTNININTSSIGLENSRNSEVVSELFSDNNGDFVNLNPGGSLSDGVTNEVAEEPEIESPVVNDNEEAFFDPSSDEDDTPTESTSSGSISQRLQYLEFPIEIAYNLIDKKIGVDIIGGFSTFILSSNQTTFETNSNSTSLGETTALNNTSFSTNIGFSADYNIAKNLSFNVEPLIKFQLNSFDNSTDYTPILFGLSSGVVWKF